MFEFSGSIEPRSSTKLPPCIFRVESEQGNGVIYFDSFLHCIHAPSRVAAAVAAGALHHELQSQYKEYHDSRQPHADIAMDSDSSQADARLINAAIAQSAEACMLLLHSRPHLRQPLITDLLRSSHQLDHSSILRIFALAVFGHEPSQALQYLQQLKPAGYCGHVFKEGEISYKYRPLYPPPPPPPPPHPAYRISCKLWPLISITLISDVSTALRMQLVLCAPNASTVPTTLATDTSCTIAAPTPHSRDLFAQSHWFVKAEN